MPYFMQVVNMKYSVVIEEQCVIEVHCCNWGSYSVVNVVVQCCKWGRSSVVNDVQCHISVNGK